MADALSLLECPRIEESLQDSVSTLVKTSSWGTGTTTSTTSGNSTRLCPRKSDGWRERDFESPTTSTTSGNSTRLCPRKSDGWRERDFESHVQAPLMPAYSLFARTQACVLEIYSFSK